MNNWAGLAQPHLLLEMSYTQEAGDCPREGGGDGEGSGEGEGVARLLQPLASSQSVHFNSRGNVAIFYPSAFHFKNIQTMQDIG